MSTRHLLTLVFFLFAVAPGQSKKEWERRDTWQKPEDIIQALKVREGDWVGDIGSGDGYLTRHLLEAAGRSGKVFAVDINEVVLENLRSRFEEGNPQLTIVLGETDDPKLPSSALNSAVILQSYHEMTSFVKMLERIKGALKEGGRLVIVDAISKSRESLTRPEQVEKHEISSGIVVQDLSAAGFEILSVEEEFAKPAYHDRMWMVISRKPTGNKHTD